MQPIFYFMVYKMQAKCINSDATTYAKRAACVAYRHSSVIVRFIQLSVKLHWHNFRFKFKSDRNWILWMCSNKYKTFFTIENAIVRKVRRDHNGIQEHSASQSNMQYSVFFHINECHFYSATMNSMQKKEHLNCCKRKDLNNGDKEAINKLGPCQIRGSLNAFLAT